MRKWVIAVAVMILAPWATSLVWMHTAGIEAKAGQWEAEPKEAGQKESGQWGSGKEAGQAERGDGKTEEDEAEEGRSGESRTEGIGSEEGMEGGAAPDEEGEARRQETDEGAGGDQKDHIQRKILVERKGIRTYIELEDYLPGVMICQIDGDYEAEALKCQAVIARTYIYRLMEGRQEIYEEELDMDYLGEGEGGLYGDRIKLLERMEQCREAAEATCGVVMKYEDRYILPLFHGMSAGRTRKGDSEFPYLQSVESAADTRREDYMQVMEWSRDSFAAAVSQIPGSPGVSPEQLPGQIQTIKKDDAGYMTEMKIGTGTYSGEEIQYALGLPSCCFGVEGDGDTIRVRVRGRGHGYGLSQAGADSMAKDGWRYEDILNHYYKNISLISE